MFVSPLQMKRPETRNSAQALAFLISTRGKDPKGSLPCALRIRKHKRGVRTMGKNRAN